MILNIINEFKHIRAISCRLINFKDIRQMPTNRELEFGWGGDWLVEQCFHLPPPPFVRKWTHVVWSWDEFRAKFKPRARNREMPENLGRSEAKPKIKQGDGPGEGARWAPSSNYLRIHEAVESDVYNWRENLDINSHVFISCCRYLRSLGITIPHNIL